MISINQIKTQSRLILDGRYRYFGLLTFGTGLLNLLLSFVVRNVISGDGSLFSLLLSLAASAFTNMIYYLVLAGILNQYLHLCRQKELHFEDVFLPFKIHPEAGACYGIVQFVLQTIAVNAGFWIFDTIYGKPLAEHALLLAAALAGTILYLWLQTALCMYLFLYCDHPFAPIPELFRECFRMMQGNRLYYLRLLLSFAGMYLLSILSLGLGLLVIYPYIHASEAQFFINLCSPQINHGDGA